jgi:hypothetical protein
MFILIKIILRKNCVLYVSWTIVHGRRLSTDKIIFFTIVHISWTRAIFHEQFFQKTVHDTRNIYNLICSIQMELSPFGTLLKFSWKLCLEFLGNIWMHIWQSLYGEKTFLLLYFISIVHEMWKITMFRGQFFRKTFNLIFHGHCPYNMDNCPWTIDVHGQLSTKRTRRAKNQFFCPSFTERKDEWRSRDFSWKDASEVFIAGFRITFEK